MENSFLIRNGKIVDPKSGKVQVGDLRIEGGRIAEIGTALVEKAGEKTIDATGKLVMPGLVDPHMHLEGSTYGWNMLARAGVTTALEMDATTPPPQYIEKCRKYGSGICVAFVSGLIPRGNLSGPDPSASELAEKIDQATSGGAMGVKLIGGHMPLTRRATADVVRLCHERRVWMAFHTGTVETNGDIRGMVEAVELSQGMPMHIAHINSYCRGGVYAPVEEAKIALEAIKSNPNLRTESYLALINGTSGYFTDETTPRSRVTANELRRAGYEVSKSALRQAILDGRACVNGEDTVRKEVVLLPPEEGLKYYDKNDGKVTMSFYANSPISSTALALSKDSTGKFIVDALSTDGGKIPRNLTLHQGLLLVKFGAFTLQEFSHKASLAGARMLGFTDRGYIQEGAAADVIVVDYDKMVPELVFADGKLICDHGDILGSDCRIVTTERGRKALEESGAQFYVHQPDWLEGVPRSAAAPCALPSCKKTIGILGGVGPFATVDLFQKLVKATPARSDQEHPHTIIDNDCQIPDRTAALLGKGPSPVPEMLSAARRLEAAGADFIIMPCNTAHAFLPEVEPYVQIPFINMIQSVVAYIQEKHPAVKKVGLLATTGTVKSGVYAKELEAAGLEIVVPDEAVQADVMDAIYSPEYGIKAGGHDKAREKMLAAGKTLVAKGAQAVILGCTEIPLVVGGNDLPVPAIDATEILAQAAVKRSQNK
ncbi:MAG: amino acid racemase [Victivallales bacterium]|nr:amino acid racemase [Victivallales bacterium]